MNRIVRLTIAALIALSLPLAAWAIEIGEAKQQGLVGETDTGYIAATGASPGGEVAALVQSVNAQRKQVYQKAADKNGVPLAEVEKLGAKKALQNTPAGQQVRIGGAWKTK